ncbi:unnamed protein product [Gulo gulo]|uniref:Uncharacterized protein n=1 Tax=Gulo gulo TaxID=48420 RepID=A0A9X9Q2X2_GULGU|nr:unnamed protein product [Gulo gulo]
MLSSILAETASGITDGPAAASRGTEQREYAARARQYSSRSAVRSSSLTRWKNPPPLPSLTSQPHQALASEPVPFPDWQPVPRRAVPAYSALSHIPGAAEEELAVRFGIPRRQGWLDSSPPPLPTCPPCLPPLAQHPGLLLPTEKSVDEARARLEASALEDGARGGRTIWDWRSKPWPGMGWGSKVRA